MSGLTWGAGLDPQYGNPVGYNPAAGVAPVGAAPGGPVVEKHVPLILDAAQRAQMLVRRLNEANGLLTEVLQRIGLPTIPGPEKRPRTPRPDEGAMMTAIESFNYIEADAIDAVERYEMLVKELSRL